MHLEGRAEVVERRRVLGRNGSAFDLLSLDSERCADSDFVRKAPGLLNVLAGHAAVRNELFHHRADIATRLRQSPGGGPVKAINLRSG